MENVSPLLKKREAAARLRVVPRTLERLVASGTGPVVTRVGSRVFFLACDIDEWLAKQRQPAKRPAA